MGWSSVELYDAVNKVIHEFVPPGDSRVVAYVDILGEFENHDFDGADDAYIWDEELRTTLKSCGYLQEEDE